METQKKETPLRQQEEPQTTLNEESISERRAIVKPDASTWLADMRRARNLTVKDVLPVIKVRYEKCDAALYSKVERPGKYGVRFIPSLEKAIQQAFDYKPLRGRRSDNRALPKRVQFRLSENEYARLQMAISASVHDTVQDWGRDMALKCIKDAGVLV